MDTRLTSIRAAIFANNVNDDTFFHTCRAAKKRWRVCSLLMATVTPWIDHTGAGEFLCAPG